MSELTNTIEQLFRLKKDFPNTTKTDIEKYALADLKLSKKRSVYVGSDFAIRFSEVRGVTSGFSNVVLSLSALLKYDNNPFVVCVVRANKLDFLLANTTFLKKISHSSHQLTIDNIKGSFLGQDIAINHEGIANNCKNFLILFEKHCQIELKDNICRLVDATDSITARKQMFQPSEQEKANILKSPSLFISSIKKQ